MPPDPRPHQGCDGEERRSLHGYGKDDRSRSVLASASPLLRDAPLNTKRTYPALTFTPGLQSYNEVNSWFGEGMAEDGYVVLIIDPRRATARTAATRPTERKPHVRRPIIRRSTHPDCSNVDQLVQPLARPPSPTRRSVTRHAPGRSFVSATTSAPCSTRCLASRGTPRFRPRAGTDVRPDREPS
jgi:hypothetical protein